MTGPASAEWRPMAAADLAAVTAISDAVHLRYRESAATYIERLALYPAGCRMLWAPDGRIIGYLISHPWRRADPPALDAVLGAIPVDADTYYLHDIALLPAARGTGAGTAATAFVAEQAARAGFGDVTLIAVNGADSFWAAQGFLYAQAGENSPYGPGTHVMHRPL